MSVDPSSSVTQARKDLGTRLRLVRRAAGLTGRALADAIGQHPTRISRIEHGVQLPTEANIRAWCRTCGATDQIADLLATAWSVDSAYVEWTRQSRAGMRRLGDLHSIAGYQRSTAFRIHEPTVMPGIFQTEAYLRRMLAFWYQFLDAPDDTDATIAARRERIEIALSPSKRVAAVLGEQVLYTRRGSPAEHADQLVHLMSLMGLPHVSVAVIPRNAQRLAIATIGYWIFDDSAVSLETPTAAIKVTRPQEVRLYRAMFDQLGREAVQGRDAFRLVASALDSTQSAGADE